MIPASVIMWAAFVVALPVAVISFRTVRAMEVNERALTISLSVLVVGAVVLETGIVGSGVVLQIVFMAIVGLTCLAGVLRIGDVGKVRVRWVLLSPALISIVAAFSNSFENPSISAVYQFGRFVPAILWVLFGILFSSKPPTAQQVLVAVSLGAAVASLLAPVTYSVSRPCDDFKCGVFGYIYLGPFPSENYFAKVAAIAFIVALFSTATALRWFTLALCLIVLVAATSRTAILAIVVSVGIALVVGRARRPLRAVAVWLVSISTVAISAYVVLTASPTDFSNRGWIWTRTVKAIDDDYWLGLGVDRWYTYQNIGLLPDRFPHNQYLLIVFCGGIVCALLYFWVVTALGQQMVDSGDAVTMGVGVFTYISFSGLTEVMWNPSTVDGTSFTMAVLVALSACGMPARSFVMSSGLETRAVLGLDLKVDRRRASPMNPNSTKKPAFHHGRGAVWIE